MVFPKNFKLGRGFTGDASASFGARAALVDGTTVVAPPAQDARVGAFTRAALDSILRTYSRARASARAWPSPSGGMARADAAATTAGARRGDSFVWKP
jgi:hypothetical protein